MSLIRSVRVSALVCALGFAPVAFADAPQTVVDAVQRALLQQPEVLAKVHAFNAAVDEQAAVRGGWFPRVDLTAGTGRDWRELPGASSNSYTRTGASIHLTQLLFDGGRLNGQIKRFGYAKQTRYFELIDASEGIALEAARAYIDVLRYRQQVKLSEDNYVQHKMVFEQIQSKVQSGVGRKVDFEQAAGRLALAESNLLTETSNLHDVSARYQRLVGELPAKTLSPVPSLLKGLATDSKQAVEMGLSQSPALLAAQANLEAAQADLGTERGNMYPTLQFRASAETTRNLNGVAGRTRQGSVELVLNYNLFNGGSDQARIRQSASKVSLAQDLRDKACVDTRQTMAIAFNDTRKLAEQLRYLEQHQLSIEKARDAYRKQFDIGQRSLLDLLDSENELFEAKRAYTNAEFDLQVARARTQAVAGHLILALGVSGVNGPSLSSDANEQVSLNPAELCGPVVQEVWSLDKTALDQRAATLLKNNAPAQEEAATTLANAPKAEEVITRTNAWANAWRAKNVNAYLGFYSASFAPEGMTRAAWEAQRRSRIGKAGEIKLTLSEMKVSFKGPDQAIVTFGQVYQSGTYQDAVTRTQTWSRVAGAWQISAEQVVAK